MLYQIGRICSEVFNIPVFVVQNHQGKRGAGRFYYPYNFPTISIKSMLDIANPNDVFFCNPVHSDYAFGSHLPCHKVMFLQGVNTYTDLDKHFDHYVSNSKFVQKHTKENHHIDSEVINPFINVELFNKGIPWQKRSNHILLLNYKKETMHEFKQLIQQYRAKHPIGSLTFRKIQDLPQKQLSTIMGQHKYYLTLTPIEGFGLPPLEAMSSGCVVLGFDGYGGRDYFTTNNSCVAEHRNYGPVIDFLHKIDRNPDEGARLSQHAMETAKQYSFTRYKKEWTHFLKERIFNG